MKVLVTFHSSPVQNDNILASFFGNIYLSRACSVEAIALPMDVTDTSEQPAKSSKDEPDFDPSRSKLPVNQLIIVGSSLYLFDFGLYFCFAT